MIVVDLVAPYLLLGICIMIAPKSFRLLRDALEEHKADRYEAKFRRRGYYYMRPDEVKEYERSIRFKPWKW